MLEINNNFNVDQIKIPMVIRKKVKNNQSTYWGFIPGLTNKDIVSINFEICKNSLLDTTKKFARKLASGELQFPFFPSKQELKEDFKDIFYLAYLKI